MNATRTLIAACVMLLLVVSMSGTAGAGAKECCYPCHVKWTYPQDPCVGDCTNDWGRQCSGALAHGSAWPALCLPFPEYTCNPMGPACHLTVTTRVCTSVSTGCPPGEFQCGWKTAQYPEPMPIEYPHDCTGTTRGEEANCPPNDVEYPYPED